MSEHFNRQVAHYLESSAMADRRVIEAIIAAAPVQPGQRVLDVACGAGFLLRAYRDKGAEVFGIDLSEAMLREAGKTVGPSVTPDRLISGDATQLPFDSGTFDVVTCKLAMHYFPDPSRVVEEIGRVCRTSGFVAVIDRVACEDTQLCAAHNELEKLRTPNKVRVYTEDQLAGLLTASGLTLVGRELLIQPMDFDEWMAAAGALNRAVQARKLLLGANGDDRTGLAPSEEAGRLVIRHRTLILAAKRT